VAVYGSRRICFLPFNWITGCYTAKFEKCSGTKGNTVEIRIASMGAREASVWPWPWPMVVRRSRRPCNQLREQSPSHLKLGRSCIEECCGGPKSVKQYKETRLLVQLFICSWEHMLTAKVVAMLLGSGISQDRRRRLYHTQMFQIFNDKQQRHLSSYNTSHDCTFHSS